MRDDSLAFQKRLTVVTAYPPLPANDGGRLDVLNQLHALSRRGVVVQLILINDERLTASDFAALSSLCTSVVQAQPRRNVLYWFRTLVLLLDRPLFAARRSFFGAAFELIAAQVAEFKPAAILSQSLDPVPLSSKLSRQLKIPMLLRSQNIEHRYKAEFARQAKGIQLIRGMLDCLHLVSFERGAFATAQRVFDISVDDLDYWRTTGFERAVWLPPMFDWKAVVPPNDAPEFDVGFVGNLHNHNNLNGLTWFIKIVLPLLDKSLGRRTRMMVAGSKPSDSLREMLRLEGIEVISDFVDLLATQHRAHVLFNPMLTGGGVALKTVEMLLSGRPVVSTARGASGLPAEIHNLLTKADGAEAFTQAILKALDRSAYDMTAPQAVVASFGYDAISPLYDDIGRPVRSN